MYIGIDLGGTNTAAALVDDEGKITERVSIPTDIRGGATGVINGLLAACGDLLCVTGEKPRSVGIGIPGTINSETGEVVFTPNLPLAGVNIKNKIREKYDFPVYIGNDANCAALGESVAGGMKGARNAVLITLGTGLGGGLISNGRLHTGLSGAAGELGHMVIIAGGRKCGCGRSGCWETYSSATGLYRTAREFMEKHSDSRLWELCGGNPDRVDGRMVFGAFRDGDRAACLIVERYIEHLAVGMVSVINILDPDIFCIGGGISGAWDCLHDPLQATVNAEKCGFFSPSAPQTQIVKATLGNDAGIIGAAMLGR